VTRESVGQRLSLFSAAALAALACLRAITPIMPMPHWDLDPLVFAAPTVGFGPVGTVTVDLLVLVCCSLGLAGQAIERRRAPGFAWAAWGLGVLVLWWHMSFRDDGADPDTLRLASNWIASAAGGLTVWSLCRDERARRLVVGVLVGLTALLAAKAIFQVFVEHPATLARFRAEKAAVFEAQGWRVDSPQALQYERRIAQNDATAWIGLSNVLGSMAAVGFVISAGLLASVLRRGDGDGPDDRPPLARIDWPLVLVAGLSLVALYLAKSKGAAAAAALGVAAFAIWMTPWRRWARYGPASAFGLAMLAVGFRGLIGERLGELSLLLRSFYYRGATSVALESPIVGTGPAHFRESFVRLKPTLCPEDVASSHSVLFDWWATMGLGGLAWIAVAVLGVVLWTKARRRDDAVTAASEDPKTALSPRLVALVCLVPVGISAALQREAALVESAVAMLLGLAAWIAGAMAIARGLRSDRAVLLAASGGLAVVLAHSQIEMTLTTEGSSLWGLALIGALLAPSSRAKPGASPVVAAAPMCGAVLLVAGALSPIASWSESLERGAERLAPAREMRERAALVNEGRLSPEAFARELGAALGERPRQNPGWVGDAALRLEHRALERARESLLEALASGPLHRPTLNALARVTIRSANLRQNGAQRALVETEAAIRRLTTERPRSVAAWIDLARFQSLGSVFSGAEDEWRWAAVRSSHTAVEVAPRDLTALTLAADLSATVGDRIGAARFASRALEEDENHRLDPLTGLDAEVEARMKSIARTAVSR